MKITTTKGRTSARRDRRHGRRMGVDLFLHQQGLGTSTPSGRAMFQMLGVSAQRHGSGVLAVGVNTSSCDFGCSAEHSPGHVVG